MVYDFLIGHMKLRRTNSVRYLWVCAVVAVAGGSHGQQTAAPNQDESDGLRQETADRLRGARLVGSNDALAMELPNGELIAFFSDTGRWCLRPQSRGGVIKIDCTVEDGPAYYFEESTRALIEVCSFWVPDPYRCPPKEWPVEVANCDGALPDGIVGTWRFSALPSAGGFLLVDGGWTMTVAEETISFDFQSGAPIARSYSIVDRAGNGSSLELHDALSETTTIDIELAPCGMLVEAESICDAFCDNLVEELGSPTDERLREMLVDRLTEDTIERILEIGPNETEQRRRQPLFPVRSYFREVIDD
jgi:hypothetical protein